MSPRSRNGRAFKSIEESHSWRPVSLMSISGCHWAYWTSVFCVVEGHSAGSSRGTRHVKFLGKKT